MTSYAAFLRGVNVGGVNLKMADVAGALADAGFAEVRTILATGNITLESRAGADTVRAKAETALTQRLLYRFEQILGFIFFDLDVCIAGDAKRLAFENAAFRE